MFGSRSLGGVDLGESSLHYAVTERGRRTVTALWSAPLPRESREEASAAPMEEIGAALQRQVTPFVREVRSVIQGRDTLCGYLELPPLKPSEMGTAVSAAAARKIPWPLEEVFLTHLPLRPLDPASPKAAAFWVAVRLDAIERHRALLARAGLVATAIDVPAVALAREAGANHALPAEEFVARVHAGFRLTQVVAVREGSPYYYRDFPLAGGDFTYGVQMGAQSTWADAEIYKRAYQVQRREPAMEAFVTRWLDEVQRSLDHFGHPVGRVLLSGGTARMEGLAPRLAEHLGLPVEVDGWDRLRLDRRVDPEAPAPEYKLAVGAALQE